ncbi:PREDICTED: polymeric immunoglobulin receptor-like, partial [Acanthisitta chloris]|uniref:polymeric immunoglobulin receptor-like n=1 Tax=Acanthisitta chloris TaxID=57068 RepID=UPI0004F0D080
MVVLLLLAALLQEPVSGSLYGSRFLTGRVGGSVTHQCFYSITPANKNDRKYWCKRARNGICYTIISSTGYTSREYEGRVSLEDIPQNGTFTVTMTGLKSSDTGTYRCGIGITNGGLYVSLNLTVGAGAAVSSPTQLIQGELHGSVTVLCPSGDAQSSKKRFWCKVGRSSCILIADSSGYVGRSYQGRIFLTPPESSGAFKVLINDLQKEDSGLYMCGTSGGNSSQEMILQVTTASALPRRPKFLSSTPGGSTSFKCHYDPKRSYEKKYLCRWKEGNCSLLLDADGFVHESYKGRVQVTSSDPRRGTYTVLLSQLREEDAGWYWCRAQSGHTEHTSSVKLRILKGPDTTTHVKPILSSLATYSTPTQRRTTDLRYVRTTGTKSTVVGTITKSNMMGTIPKSSTMGTITKGTAMGTESTSTLLPAATFDTFGTSPGEIYPE